MTQMPSPAIFPSRSDEDFRLAWWQMQVISLRHHLRLLRIALTCTLLVMSAWGCLFVLPCQVACCHMPNDDARNAAFELGKSVELYRLQMDAWPSELTLLLEPPRGRPLMKRIPSDPWGNPYRLVIPGLRNPSRFDIVSFGPDGKPYTDDDVGNWPAE